MSSEMETTSFSFVKKTLSLQEVIKSIYNDPGTKLIMK